MFVKIWTVSNCKFDANFLTFLGLYHMLFAVETIGVSEIIIWLLIFEKKPFQFWREIWIWVLVILLQLYLHRFWLRRDKECCSEEWCFRLTDNSSKTQTQAVRSMFLNISIYLLFYCNIWQAPMIDHVLENNSTI